MMQRINVHNVIEDLGLTTLVFVSLISLTAIVQNFVSNVMKTNSVNFVYLSSNWTRQQELAHCRRNSV